MGSEVAWFTALCSATDDACALEILAEMGTEEERGVLGHMGAVGEVLQVCLSRGFVAATAFLLKLNPLACVDLLVSGFCHKLIGSDEGGAPALWN